MKIHNVYLLITVMFMASHLNAMDPATMALVAQILPQNLSVDIGFDFTNQTLKQKCYGTTVKNNVYNDGGTVKLAQGSCQQVAAQQIGAFGKTGDLFMIPVDDIAHQTNFTLSSRRPYVKEFKVPQFGWQNAQLFEFILSGEYNDPWSSRGFVGPIFKGRTAQVVVRTQALTAELAQKEGFTYQPNQILLEVWARMVPSITGLENFKQIFNLVLNRKDQNRAAFVFVGQPTGLVAIAHKITDTQNTKVQLVSQEFNVVDEAKTIK